MDIYSALHVLTQAFREYVNYANYMTSDVSYKSASSKLENLNFATNDVSAFAELISNEDFTDKANYWTVGLFISAAINKAIKEEETIMLDFTRLGYSVDCIGYGLGKGTIVLEGNVEDYLGERMSGGKITILGNAGNYVGYSMSGGEIAIHGNAGIHFGTYMSGGIIRIEGKIDSISESCRGRIYRGETLLR